MMDPLKHRGTPSHPHPRAHKSNNSNETNHQRVRFAEEEEPEPSSSKLHQPTPTRPTPSAATSTGVAPDVYWDDRESRDPDANLAQYTFYREGTPTPPEHDSQDRGLGHGGLAAPVAESSAGGGGGFGSGADAFNHSQGGTSLAESKKMAPATKKKMIRALIVVGVLIIVGIAVGVGAGFGVKLSRKGSEEVVEGSARFVNTLSKLSVDVRW